MSEKKYEKVKGKFSEKENEIFHRKLEEYWLMTNPDKPQSETLKWILTSKSSLFWPFLLHSIPYIEPRNVCYHYRCVLSYYVSRERPWTKEDINKMMKLHKNYPNNWKKIASELQRDSVHCKDIYDVIISGENTPWTKEEEKTFFWLVSHIFGSNLPDSHHQLPIKKVIRYFPDRSTSSILLKWQTDIWPMISRTKSATTEWTPKDTKYLIMKVCLQRPNEWGDIDFFSLSKKWPLSTIQYQFQLLVKVIPVSAVLPLRVVLSQLLQKYSLSLEVINQTKSKEEYINW